MAQEVVERSEDIRVRDEFGKLRLTEGKYISGEIDVPTWREQGYDAVVSNWRIIVGPKGMTAAQVAYGESTLGRMVESEEWKKELEANFWTSEYMGSAETRKFLERENAQSQAFLADLGLAK